MSGQPVRISQSGFGAVEVAKLQNFAGIFLKDFLRMVPAQMMKNNSQENL